MFETSAGAILYTCKDGEIRYLLIRDFHGNWGFPKGHLENEETEIEAAEREIFEETGIKALIDEDFRDELNYTMPNGIDKKSIYFLASYEDQIPVKQEEEVQEIKLLDYEDTLDILTFENMKEVLRKADRYIHEKQRTAADD